VKKNKIAFIKFGGLSAGGTERWLQMMAANLPKDQFDIDFYYCEAAPYKNSNYHHTGTDPKRLAYMQKHNINLIEFKVGMKDITTPTHDWIDTNFWDLFDETKYDIIQTAKAGPAEYPYHLLKKPVVEFIALDAGVDFGSNIAWSIHLSQWQRLQWIRKGGNPNKSSVIPIPAYEPRTNENMRSELGIPIDAIVAGFHQRPDNNILSTIPLEAFSQMQNPNFHFIIMGGGSNYRKQAKKLQLSHVYFIESNSSANTISRFLNTLDIFSHGRKDGETFGTVFAEAMMHGLPCLSHWSPIANAQPETMGPAGLFAQNLSDYREKLFSLYNNEEIRNSLAKKAMPFANAHYSLSQCVANLASLYSVIVENQKRSSFLKKQYHSYRSELRKLKFETKLKYLLSPKALLKRLYNKEL
jgi:hypothetical protein